MGDNLYDHLKAYGESDVYPFHMPGHKRNTQSGPFSSFYQYDITEIAHFDNLHQAEGILLEAQKRAARLYGSEETFFIVNGSTAGILSAISAVATKGKKLIIARNCHKSVYHAAFLCKLELEYLYPEILEEYGLADGFSANQIAEKIREIAKAEEVAGIVITSPTYDGIISDVAGIVEVAHTYEIPVIVDQAHGAHFGFHPGYPQSAVAEGADLVIHSVHKTLPAPTQTALLHVNGTLVNREKLRKYLQIYQTSSPSYLLMTGIDSCMALLQREGRDRLDNLLKLRRSFTEKTKDLRYIQIYPSMAERGEDVLQEWTSGSEEPGRLLISVKDSSITGQELHDILKDKYRLQMEMYGADYVVAILSMMDREEGLERLATALSEIDEKISALSKYAKAENNDIIKDKAVYSGVRLSGREFLQRPQKACLINEAFTESGIEILLSEADCRISAEFINLYPPGIPFLVPGERFDKAMIEIIMKYLENGYTLQGIKKDNKMQAIVKVLR